MRKLKELLRLKFDAKLTHRQIGRALNISPSTVCQYAQAATALGLTWPLDESVDDDELIQRLEPYAKQLCKPKSERAMPDWASVHDELSKKHMTLAIIWEDYAKLHSHTYSYAQFTRLYNGWCKQHKVTMRLNHIPGDKAFIDYAGDTIPVYSYHTKQVIFSAQLFIMVLGASNYTFVYASASQKLPDWIDAHVHAFEFFGGTPRILIPDNLRTGITDSCQFEPLANQTYADMATHYNTAIIPARPYTPRDKAKAKSCVLIVERWIMTRLLKQRFYTINALNNAIKELLAAMNQRSFQKKQGSRHSQFIELEKNALHALPSTRYEFAQFNTQMLPNDYHIRIDSHYYSVPYTLVKQEVFCRYTTSTVEVFHQGQRVASHLRSFEKDQKTTCLEHMPNVHRKYAEWTPQTFLDWAEQNGSSVANLAAEIVSIKPHPEQCSKIHFGLKRLSKEFGKQRLNQACQRALAVGCLQFKSIESILKHNLDQIPHLSVASPNATPKHPNVRGADYYKNLP